MLSTVIFITSASAISTPRDAAPHSVVEFRRCEDAKDRGRVVLAARSELSIEKQVHANGATWLDQQLVTREPTEFGEGGFGGE